MSKTPNLAAAMADAGGSTRRRVAPPPPERQMGEDQARGGYYRQPSRVGKRPITVHFPEEVRNQLKMIALQQKKTLQELMAEGFNDLFAKYGKPEIAPTERGHA